MYRKLKAPLSVQIEVTTRCGNACVHCYNHWRHDDSVPNRSMTPDEAGQVVDMLAAAEVFDVVITGGEPLLARETTRTLLTQAKLHGLNASLNSSLTELTAEDAEWLQSSGLTSVLTSVHGPREIHDHIVCRQGALDATIRGIAIARSAGIPVHANMVISRDNKNFVAQTAAICAQAGASLFLASKAAWPEHCAEFAPHALTMEDIAGYVAELRSADVGIPVEMLSTFPLCALPEAVDVAIRGRRCLAGIAMMTIAADGTARPCNHTDLAYGNIFETPLAKLWAAMSDWRNGAFLPEICQKCPTLLLCGGGCRVEARTRNNRLDTPDPYANPDNLPELCAALRTREHHPPKFPHRFRVNPHRVRSENCGAVLCAPGGAPLLMSPAGAKVWEQFENNRTYTHNDPSISWGALDIPPFLAALARKKLITSVEESS